MIHISGLTSLPHRIGLGERFWIGTVYLFDLSLARSYLPLVAAIRVANVGGIRNGRYPGAKWVSPLFV